MPIFHLIPYKQQNLRIIPLTKPLIIYIFLVADVKITRKAFGLIDKIEILEKIENECGVSMRSLSKKLGISRATLSRIKNNKKKLREKWNNQKVKKNIKKERTGKCPLVEEALVRWYFTMQERQEKVSGPLLRSKAIEFADHLGIDDFKPTSGWFSRWKARNEIELTTANGDKPLKKKISANDWLSVTLPGFMYEFYPDDIYNVKETGLYYCATPDGNLYFNKDQFHGHKKSTQRLIILLCTNMTGSDKLKPLVIGKDAKPKSLKGIKNLPVEYCSNKQVWMTSEIFKTWLFNWDKQLKRSILLILESCVAHPKLEGLKHIRLEFIPKNLALFTHPLDWGIIKNMKTLYRHKLVTFIKNEIDNHNLETNELAHVIGTKINLLQSIQFISESWDEVTPITITNCFGYAGFNIPDYPYEEIDMIEEPMFGFQEYVDCDADLECYDTNMNLELSIIDSMQPIVEISSGSGNKKEDLEQEFDFDEIKNSLVNLRRFIKKSTVGPLTEVNTCIQFINKKCKKQVVVNSINIRHRNKI